MANGVDIGTVIGLIKGLSPKPDAATIEAAVSDWLDEHPEATTTVEDGAISYAKLDSSLQSVASSAVAASISNKTLTLSQVT